ncbi:flagellar protein FlaG [Thermodesulfobacteriota bacterium B35]
MNVDTLSMATASPPRIQEPADQITRQRQEVKGEPATAGGDRQNRIQPEELLDQIKSITENGAYSVRFEKDNDLDELIVKVVDQQTSEVIRQIPPEELVNLSKHLQELRGNIVNTVS